LNVRFVPGQGGIVVRFDKAGGLVIPERRAGGWTEPVRSTDGLLTQANIWLSADERLLDSCEGLTKTLLHELGHLHGLADREALAGPSVMNRVAGKNDRGGAIPIAPTMCDAAQARRASTTGSLHALQCGVPKRTGDR